MRKIDLKDFQVATSETARDINRRIVLNLIRSHQPVSRADLARHSGLQRSTVSVIAEQLIREKWVKEGAIGHAPRGRRPRFLHLNKEHVGILAVDIRPAITTIALADVDGHFVAQETIETSPDPNLFLEHVRQRLRHTMRMRPDTSYEGIGVSLPGRVDLETQRLVFAPNLRWKDLDLRGPLENATGLSVELENAANACALAGVWFGRKTQGVANLIAVTVSEGIGTGLILNHQLVPGSTGLAGEFGHAAIVENGLRCSCGNRGCWEVYASNSAAVRYYGESISPVRPGRLRQRLPAAPGFEDILRLAEQGDLQARSALKQMAEYLGAGIAMLVTGLAPDVIMVVGEVTRLWDQIEPVLKESVKRRSFTPATTRILPSDPAVQPRLLGAVALVLQRHFGAPEVA
jgi:predicted NBD/HSP70 family sugar kinase